MVIIEAGLQADGVLSDLSRVTNEMPGVVQPLCCQTKTLYRTTRVPSLRSSSTHILMSLYQAALTAMTEILQAMTTKFIQQYRSLPRLEEQRAQD